MTLSCGEFWGDEGNNNNNRPQHFIVLCCCRDEILPKDQAPGFKKEGSQPPSKKAKVAVNGQATKDNKAMSTTASVVAADSEERKSSPIVGQPSSTPPPAASDATPAPEDGTQIAEGARKNGSTELQNASVNVAGELAPHAD